LGHTTETCLQKEGAIEGKKDKVLAMKAKARADHRKEKPNGT
jgi:hypothetical protein